MIFASITPEPQKPDPVLGLKFTIEARYGGTVLVDMTRFNPRPLAIAFAGALRRLAALGGPLGAATTVRQYGYGYRRFFAWLGDQAPEVVGPGDLRAIHIDGFAEALERSGIRAGTCHGTVSMIVNTLRVIEADGRDWIAPDLQKRLRYILATSVGCSTPRDAYSPFVARALRDAARIDVEAMFRRLRVEDRTDDDKPAIVSARANVEAIIARDGSILTDQRDMVNLYALHRRHGLPSDGFSAYIHGRHHLLGSDLPSLLVMLTLDTGLEPECLPDLSAAGCEMGDNDPCIRPGRVYEPGHIELDEEKGLVVTIGNTIRTFETQIEAEGHLWRAYAASEFTF